MENEILTYRNPFQASWHMFRHEGASSFWKGIGAVIAGAPFASALYFGGVEITKTIGYRSLDSSDSKNTAMIDFLSGMIGQLCGSLAWVPMDVLKERCQVEGQVKTVISYRSTSEAFSGILKHEGIGGLYRAYFIHQFTWAPFNGVYWMVYGQCKSYLGNHYFNNNRHNKNKNLQTFLISSSVAGIISSVITSPLDLVKTRMQVRRSNPHLFDFTNPFECAVQVFQREGVLAFFDGVAARVLWLTPRYIVAVSLFDMMKQQWVDNARQTSLEEEEKENLQAHTL